MNIRLAVFTAYTLLKEHYHQHDDIFVKYRQPDGKISEEVVPAREAAKALQGLINHVYPKSESTRYQMVVTCEHCKYWKRLKNKRDPRKVRMVCTYGDERKVTQAKFFCGNAQERSQFDG